MSYARMTMIYPGKSSSVSQEESAPEGDPQVALGRWSGRRRSKARVQKLENSRPKPERMEETLEGGGGPPQAVAPLGGGVKIMATQDQTPELTKKDTQPHFDISGRNLLCNQQTVPM
jgi:hypothetical protein